ncbi:PadR family transcriptional regulator [Streptomyces sp. NBC_01803]|uniref:PadR family transcriptional regulator n=1 Tax=Streptomyces sp. NBC_01803 TaxID=2975946 RepID=UPI002DD9ED3E|nr:PadR family transcriptional regulator [Streptomyces sp. NBC_01803]WSA44302.1 PadR family transcriptional regulator [Streptomyces sp. NBC_01803]
MAPVFGHGRLRLYLLKLLGEAPRHGYEVIRLLEERFQGLYAPSAGTVYPRLAKLAAEGLVTHTEEGGRKVYSLTPEGQRELLARGDELTELEREIRDSLAALAADIREDVSGSARDLRQEIRQAAAATRATSGTNEGRARVRREASDATRHHFEEAARRIHDRVQSRAASGDWPGAVRESLDGLSHEIGGWARFVEYSPAARPGWGAEPTEPVDDPTRELERLLDKLRDEVRDAARDHGVTQESLREARRHLSTTAAHVVALLRSPDGNGDGNG